MSKIYVAIAAALGLAIFDDLPAASAGDAMTKVDCTKAASLMSDASKMGSGTAATGNQDKDFVAIMTSHEKGTIILMQVEASCGKDAKIRAFVQQNLSDQEQRMALFRNVGTSQ